MQPYETVSTNGRPPSAAQEAGAPWELDGLRSICWRQARMIDKLRETVSNLRSGASALKAENADLRAQHNALSGRSSPHTPGTGSTTKRPRDPTGA